MDADPEVNFRHDPVLYVIQKLPFLEATQEKVRSQDNFCRSGREHSPAPLSWRMQCATLSSLANTSSQCKGTF